MNDRITTESGAVYLRDGNRIMRVTNQSDHEKRGDGKWLTLHNDPVFRVGERAILAVESLAALGPDDHGTPPEMADPDVTVRVTTPVVRIEENDQ